MMPIAKPSPPKRGPRKSDKWIPWYFVAFFLVLFVLDGFFVSLALRTHTGVVTEHAYTKGLAYNATIAASKQQDALRWNSTITYSSDSIAFMLTDKDNAPLAGSRVTAYFSSPMQAEADFSLKLDEIKNGYYSHGVNFPHKGQWDVKVSATWNKQHYQQHKRIIVK